MASPTTPTHGKDGAVYRRRANGFAGIGLNDLTWGTAATNAASAYYEIVIDGTGTPDTFKWRKNGGGWTALVSITGAAQTLDEGQQITFAATTGHTAADQWVAGNLVAEPCTESGATAQITSSARRMLDPNNPPTFTDSGGQRVLYVDYTTGTAYFDGNVAIVTCAGNLGYVPAATLYKVGYVRGWTFNTTLDMADISSMGDKWKTGIPGMAGFTGTCEMAFIGSKSFLDALTDTFAGDKYCLLELFNYDPDQDQTGDHFTCWAIFATLALPAQINDVVRETLSFSGDGIPSFTANS